MAVMIILLVAGLGYVIFGESSSRGMVAHCRAMQALVDWREANPESYIGDSDYARVLVLACLSTWESFLETHSYAQDDGKMELLRSLLDEHSPPPPGDYKEIPIVSPAPGWGLFMLWQEWCKIIRKIHAAKT